MHDCYEVQGILSDTSSFYFTFLEEDCVALILYMYMPLPWWIVLVAWF